MEKTIFSSSAGMGLIADSNENDDDFLINSRETKECTPYVNQIVRCNTTETPDIKRTDRKMNNFPLETDVRVQVDERLKNLGWELNGKNQNVFFEQPKNEITKIKVKN